MFKLQKIINEINRYFNDENMLIIMVFNYVFMIYFTFVLISYIDVNFAIKTFHW